MNGDKLALADRVERVARSLFPAALGYRFDPTTERLTVGCRMHDFDQLSSGRHEFRAHLNEVLGTEVVGNVIVMIGDLPPRRAR